MFLQEFFEAAVDELRRFIEETLSVQGPTHRLRRQLRMMYGRGEVPRETFYQLLGKLEKGYYIEGELQSLHRQAVRRMEIEGRAGFHSHNREIARSLDRLAIHQAIIDETRMRLNLALSQVQTQRQWARQQADDFMQRAKAAMPDETSARALLEVRLQLLDHSHLLEQRAAALQNDLLRLEALEMRLGMYEAELMIADSRERLAREELSLLRLRQ
ncbi:MAG: hypothetical protein GX491_02735 [Chloroflexi bacterium]|nr:hypothetical protein [Chloroflexota bacterium]